MWVRAIVLVACVMHKITAEGPIVRLADGDLEGLYETSSNGYEINTFLNVPYAKPPVDDLRWKAPEPSAGWTGIRNATQKGATCWMGGGSIPTFTAGTYQDEDCLYLNIFTPDIKSNKGRIFPVMLWWHGGGFSMDWGGDPLYDGYELCRKDVIVITGNYRLDIAGFLSTGDSELSGNWGLFDQLAMLKWVQGNIEHFNGDPTSVTIFGESAGAASVSLHLLSPMSEGLFHRAIAQSGSALAIWTVQSDPMRYARRLAAAVDCPSDDKRKMVQCLRKIDAKTLHEASFDKSDSAEALAPVVDGPTGFLPETPAQLLKDRKYNKDIPFMTGVNKDEGHTLMSAYAGINAADVTYEKLLDHVIPVLLKKGRFADPTGEMSNSLLMEYLNWDDPYSDDSARRSAIDALSDVGIISATDLEAQYFANNSERVYVYRLDFVSEHFPWNPYVGHAVDLIYVFGLAFQPSFEVCVQPDVCFNTGFLFNQRDRHFTETILNMWTDFAKYGDPTQNVSEHGAYNETNWLPFTEKNGYFMPLDETFDVKRALCARGSEYWNYNWYRLYDTIQNLSTPSDCTTMRSEITTAGTTIKTVSLATLVVSTTLAWSL